MDRYLPEKYPNEAGRAKADAVKFHPDQLTRHLMLLVWKSATAPNIMRSKQKLNLKEERMSIDMEYWVCPQISLAVSRR